MQGKTHTRGGEVAALTGYLLLSSNGSLNKTPIPGIVSFAIIYPFALWGSTAPDQDHNSHSIPNKDVVSMSIYYILHATSSIRKRMKPHGALYTVLGLFDAKHRSWQTHSIESLLIWIFLAINVVNPNKFSYLNIFESQILQLVFTGISLGWLSHIILDGITPEGIWIASFKAINTYKKKHLLPEKIKIMPKSSFFATGNGWELGEGYFPGIRAILTVTSSVLFIITVLDWLNWLNPLLGFLTY